MDSKLNQKIVYGAGEGYPSTGTTPRCKAGPIASLSSNRGHPGVGRQALGRVHASGEGDTRTGRSRRGSRADDEMSLCSSSPAVAGAAGKRSYHKITGFAEGTVAAATIRGGADGSDDARSDETKTGPIDK